MRRSAEWALAIAAIVLCVAFTGGVSGWGRSIVRESAPPSPLDRYYHSGKVPPAAPDSGGCRAPGCHAGSPHSKARAQAAFRNMHVRFVECLACHGKDARNSWVPGRPAAQGTGGGRGSRWTIAAPRPAVSGKNLHALTGPALSCRACHSESGARELAAKGFKDLPSGFASPVPLRMVEEGGKQWIPDTIR